MDRGIHPTLQEQGPNRHLIVITLFVALFLPDNFIAQQERLRSHCRRPPRSAGGSIVLIVHRCAGQECHTKLTEQNDESKNTEQVLAGNAIGEPYRELVVIQLKFCRFFRLSTEPPTKDARQVSVQLRRNQLGEKPLCLFKAQWREKGLPYPRNLLVIWFLS